MILPIAYDIIQVSAIKLNDTLGQMEKLLNSILMGQQDKNIKFQELQHVLKYLGFRERIRGDHFIYTKDGIAEKNKYTTHKITSKAISGKASESYYIEI